MKSSYEITALVNSLVMTVWFFPVLSLRIALAMWQSYKNITIETRKAPAFGRSLIFL
ncbi:MAG: hypothetical protein IKL76_04000 [Clostridia bacterium]|nr:hypothetical protein [Clostridia bacterium]